MNELIRDFSLPGLAKVSHLRNNILDSQPIIAPQSFFLAARIRGTQPAPSSEVPQDMSSIEDSPRSLEAVRCTLKVLHN